MRRIPSRRTPEDSGNVIDATPPAMRAKGLRAGHINMDGDVVGGVVNGGLYKGQNVTLPARDGTAWDRLQKTVPAWDKLQQSSPRRIPAAPVGQAGQNGLQAGPSARVVPVAAAPAGAPVMNEGVGRQSVTRAAALGGSMAAGMVNPLAGAAATMGAGNPVPAAPVAAPAPRADALNGVRPDSLPTGGALTVRADGTRSITGNYGSGSSRPDTGPVSALAGAYNEDGSKFVSERQHYADTLAGVKAGVNNKVAARSALNGGMQMANAAPAPAASGSPSMALGDGSTPDRFRDAIAGGGTRKPDGLTSGMMDRTANAAPAPTPDDEERRRKMLNAPRLATSTDAGM